MSDRLANYEPVQARLARFWTDHPDGRVDCELLEHDERHVLARARIWRHIDHDHPAAVGFAAEVHDGSPVNRQGWMIENAETSAIGRALANAGYAPSGARPSAEDMQRAEDRNRTALADKARAQVTFDRLKLAKGTPLADSLRALATEHDRKLTLAALVEDPAWRATVDEHLNAEPPDAELSAIADEVDVEGSTSTPDEMEPRGSEMVPRGSIGSRGRADDATLEQIRGAAARLDLNDDDLLDVAANVLGREVAAIDRLTKTSAAKVAAELLSLVAALVAEPTPSEPRG